MTKEKYLEESSAIDGTKLWDTILKTIVAGMPSQLFPLFKEIYGREYPKDTPITVLGSETTSFWESSTSPPNPAFMDIALLVNGTDYYHLECQMKNDKEMVIRMFAYDVRFAITHSKTVDENTGEITLYFPRSVVIYPEQNGALPEHLQCRVVFQDNSEHIYKIPTVRVQTYSMEEIRKKHLTLFIPYTVLRLRPKLRPNIGQKLTEKELTGFVEEVILVLKKELSDGYLTEREFDDYVKLFRMAADRVLAKHSQMRKEVDNMIGPIIKLPSMIEDELREKLTAEYKATYDAMYEEMYKAKFEEKIAALLEKDAELADMDAELGKKNEELGKKNEELGKKNEELGKKNEELGKKNEELGKKAAELAKKDAELTKKDAELTKKDAELTKKDAELTEKDAEIHRLQELISQLTVGKPVS